MSRASLIVDFTFLTTLLAPVVAYASFRLARSRRHTTHRAIQAGLLAVCFGAVVALETQIRLAGGSGSFVATAAPALQPWARGVLLVHITGAVTTYLAWLVLAIASWPRFGTALPGGFSRRHKAVGRAVFYGLCFTAASAAVMYALVFVA